MRYLHLLVILLTAVTLITPQIIGRKLQILAILLTVVTLITAQIIGSKLQNLEGIRAASLRVTVIHKNQILPSIGELEARVAKPDSGPGEVDSVDVLALHSP